jgi:carbon starvation protein
MLAGAVLGILIVRPEMAIPASTGFVVGEGAKAQYLFPMLFVLVACGAISGFHSLVGSGTSSKQLNNEKDTKLIGYGAMLVESVLAVVALVVAGSVAVNGVLPKATPFVIFSTGVAGFLTKLGLPQNVAVSYMTMCVSALALTTLDSVARIGRMAFQEFFLDSDGKADSIFKKVVTNKYFATVITLVFGFMLSLGGYHNIWPLFGSANQLLSALVLISLSVFLKTTGRKGVTLWAPMCIMLVVTFTALVQAVIGIVSKLFGTGKFVFMTDGLQIIVAVLLMALGFMVAFHSFGKLFGKVPTEESAKKAI